jgi:ferredoxin
MKIAIDTRACAGHGVCYMHAPEVLTDDDQGYGQVIGDGAVPPLQADAARDAVANCPERAISLSGDTAGQ